MSAEAKLLVVDDEFNILELLATSLRFAGLSSYRRQRPRSPRKGARRKPRPHCPGRHDARHGRLRGDPPACAKTAPPPPVLFLTAKDATEDKVTGLGAGGDDYVTKPFSLDEVIARIRAILRRSRSVQEEDDAVLRVDALSLNVDTHEVFLGDEEIDLSPTEFNLLHYLMLNANRVLSKAQILDHVWEYDFNGDSSIVESYISYLRRKIDNNRENHEPLIHTKRGVGYMIRGSRG